MTILTNEGVDTFACSFHTLSISVLIIYTSDLIKNSAIFGRGIDFRFC